MADFFDNASQIFRRDEQFCRVKGDAVLLFVIFSNQIDECVEQDFFFGGRLFVLSDFVRLPIHSYARASSVFWMI